MIGKIMYSIQERVLLMMLGILIMIVGLVAPNYCKRGIGWGDYE